MNKEKINMNQVAEKKNSALATFDMEADAARHKAYYVDHIIPLRGEKI